MLDSIVCTDKRYSKMMDATEGEGIIDEQVDHMCELLTPIKDRIIGLGEGNHERKFTDMTGSNPTKRLCERLNVPYLGYSWMCRLALREDDGRGRVVVLYGNHGWGGGSRTQGGDLTKYSKVCSSYDADLYLFGHVHRLVADRIPRLGLSGNKLIAKDRHVVVCGTFLKTISPDAVPSWAETRGFSPARIGGATIKIKPNAQWVDISVIA